MPAAETWLCVEGSNVVAVTDASQKDAVEFVVKYSAFRRVFDELLTPAGQRAPPTQLVLFRRRSSLRKYCSGAEPAGMKWICLSTQVDGNALLAMSLEGSRERVFAMAFEFETTWALSRVGYFLPLWMAQGTGKVLATMQVEKGRCIVGEDIGGFAGELRNERWLPWAEFSRVNTESLEYLHDLEDAPYHAQAWGLMHWVLLSAPTGFRDRFEALAGKVRGLVDASEVVGTVMHVAPEAIMDNVRRHLGRDATLALPFDETAVRAGIKISPAREPIVRALRAELLRAVGKTAEADVELDRVQELASDSPTVKEALARRELRRDELERAVRLYREAIASGSTNPWAYLVSARQRLNDVTGGMDRAGEGGRPADQAIGELRRALELDPGNADAYWLLGRAFFLAEHVTPDEIEELTLGLASPERGVAIRCYRALLLRRLGRVDECLAELRRVADDPQATEKQRENAREQCESIRFDAVRKEVEQLVEAKRIAAALQQIDEMLHANPAPMRLDVYRAMRALVEEQGALIELFDLLNAKRWAEFRPAAEDFLQKYPRSPRAARVRDWLQWAPPANSARAPIPPGS